jgi:hypothetical protein
LKGAAILFLIPLALTFLIVAAKLFRVYISDRSEYARNQERSPDLRSVIRGQAHSFYENVRDERVAGW